MTIQKITPFLWFDHQAEEAADVLHVDFSRLEDRPTGLASPMRGPGPAGSAMTVEFPTCRTGCSSGSTAVRILNSPRPYRSSSIARRNRRSTSYWEKLSAGRHRGPMRLAQRQIRPLVADCAYPFLPKFLGDPDPAKRPNRVMKAMMSHEEN